MNIKGQCIVLGAGGHAAVLLNSIQVSAGVAVAGVLEPDADRWNTEWM